MYGRALCAYVCARLGCFWVRAVVLNVCQSLGAVGIVGWAVMLRSACGVRAVCDGLERCCGVSGVCSVLWYWVCVRRGDCW